MRVESAREAHRAIEDFRVADCLAENGSLLLSRGRDKISCGARITLPPDLGDT